MMTAVWDLPGLSAVEKLILLSLADNANDAGVCWPSVTTIARRTSMTDRAVFKVLARLEEMGLVSRESNPGRTTTYTVTPEPRSSLPLNDVQTPLNHVQDTPEPCSPRTVKEPSENQKTKDTVVLQANRFDSFWELWPKGKRKVDRAGCLRIWTGRKLDEQADSILRAVALAKQSKDWTKDNGEWVPMPATWLRQERWLAYDGTSGDSFYDEMMAGVE